MLEQKVNLGPFLTNAFGDTYLYAVNRDAFDKVGSEALFRSHYGKTLERKDSFVVVLGTDSGVLPQYLKKVGEPEGTRFLFVELPEVLERLKEQFSLEEFSSRMNFTTYDKWLETAKAYHFQNFVFSNRLQLVPSVGAQDRNLDGYNDLVKFVQSDFDKICWEMEAGLGNELFVLRQIENLAENRHCVDCLKGQFPGKTAVMLGGGPSLDEALPWIQANRDNVVIFAVSRIARRLLQVGISPHVVVSIDPFPLSFDISKEMLLMWENTLFVNMYHVSPLLLGQWRGRSLFMGKLLPWESPLNGGEIKTVGPTVTNVALGLAIEMGFGQLLLAGVDLCFSKSGHTHAQGSNESDAGPQLGRGQFWVETNGGWQAETTADFSLAIQQIESLAHLAQSKGCQFTSLSSGAAKMEGVSYQSLHQVQLESPREPLARLFLSQLPTDDAANRVAHYQQCLEELDRALKNFRDIRKLAGEALEANDGLFGRRGKAPNFKYKKKMDKIEKRLDKDFSDFSVLVKKFGIRDFLKIVRPEKNKDWTDEEIEQTGQIYYQAYRDSAGRLIELIEDGRDRLLARLEEEKETPDFNLLFSQWEKDHQPGRYQVWMDHHAGSAPQGPDVQAKMEELEQQFQQIMAEQETQHKKRARDYTDLGPVRSKVASLFRRGDRALLAQLVDSLAALESEEGQALCLLGKGCLAELDGEVDRAIEAYQRLMDQPPGPILEDALRRVLSLSLNHNESQDALLALQCLAGLSPVYLPQYADMLRLSGDHNTALDVYADYLELVPNDLTVMLKLGRFYKELNSEEGARLMFGAVLEKDPQNRAAKALLEEVDSAADLKI